jgi:hypothetical protein
LDFVTSIRYIVVSGSVRVDMKHGRREQSRYQSAGACEDFVRPKDEDIVILTLTTGYRLKGTDGKECDLGS